MRARIVRFIFAVGISLGLLSSSLMPAAAVPLFGPTELYFPWAPWGVGIGDPDSEAEVGPYYSYLTIQNLESEAIKLFYEPAGIYAPDGPTLPMVTLLLPHATQTISAGDVYMLSGSEAYGGGIKVTATKQADDSPARIAGAIRQMSPTPGTQGITSSAHESVSGYTALSKLAIGDKIHFPIVQTNNNWNTLIRVTNFDVANASDINVMLYEAGGGGSIGPYVIPTPAGVTATIDLRQLGVPQEWVGTAVLTAGVPIGAVAERVKVETNMLLLNVARTADQTDDNTYAALIFRNWNSWNTGISIANLVGVSNEVTIDIYGMDGDTVYESTMTIPPYGMDFVYLPAGDGSPFVGAAIIGGSEPFHGIVDEVKYFGNDGDTGHAMSYTSDYLLASEGDALAVPLVAKGSGGGGDTSGIQIYNPTNYTANLKTAFYRANGELEYELISTLGPRESLTAYTLFYPEIPGNFWGSAVMINEGPGDGAIAAVSNIVNYDVQFDGSASFNAIRFKVAGFPLALSND